MNFARRISYLLLITSTILIFSSILNPLTSKAAYSDNYNRLYYDLSRLAYQASSGPTGIKNTLDSLHGKDKFKVL
jgi:hypothetical protein